MFKCQKKNIKIIPTIIHIIKRLSWLYLNVSVDIIFRIPWVYKVSQSRFQKK